MATPVEIPRLEDTKVRVIFRGFFLAKVQENKRALIGAMDPSLQSPPNNPLACHQPVVQLLEISSEGVVLSVKHIPTDPNQDFHLLVFRGASEINPEIQRFQLSSFNRMDITNSDKKDFGWFVDLDDVHDLRNDKGLSIKVEVDETRLKPKFILNKGVFHASDLSDGLVNLQRKPRGTNPPRPKDFGRFAMEITARLKLDAGTKAIFSKGNQQIFDTSQPSSGVDRYEIVFDCQCRSRENEDDFHLIYDHKLVKNVDREHEVGLPPVRSRQIRMLFNPEVYCVGGGYSFP